MKSILQTDKACFLSGCTVQLEQHHIFAGPNRKNSDKYGLWVWLRHDLHNEPPMGAHHNEALNNVLKMLGQMAFERKHSHEKFMQVFGRNYLEEG